MPSGTERLTCGHRPTHHLEADDASDFQAHPDGYVRSDGTVIATAAVRCRLAVHDGSEHRWWRGGKTWEDREYGVEWRDVS